MEISKNKLAGSVMVILEGLRTGGNEDGYDYAKEIEKHCIGDSFVYDQVMVGSDGRKVVLNIHATILD